MCVARREEAEGRREGGKAGRRGGEEAVDTGGRTRGGKERPGSVEEILRKHDDKICKEKPAASKQKTM